MEISARLLEEVEPGAVLPLQALDTNFVRRDPGPPDALVFDPYQIDGNPTLDVPARPQVGLPPLCCKATGYPFQSGPRLHSQQSIDRGNAGREVLTLLESSLQIDILL